MIYNYVCRHFSLLYSLLMGEIFANDVPVVFEFLKKREKRKKKRGKEILLSELWRV